MRRRVNSGGDEDIEIGSSGFDYGDFDPERLRAADQAPVSLITTYEGIAFDIVQGEESPGGGWSRLVRRYHMSDLKGWCRLTVGFYTMKVELGANPRNLF